MTNSDSKSLSIQLQVSFGTSLIPYEEVAEALFDFEKNTALSLLSLVSSLGLKTVRFSDSNKAPTFVFVTDLAEFLFLVGSKRLTKNIADN